MLDLINKFLVSLFAGIFNICLIALAISFIYKVFISKFFFIKFFEKNLSKKAITKIVIISAVLSMITGTVIYFNLGKPEEISLILKFTIMIIAIPFVREIIIWLLGNLENNKKVSS